MSTDLVDYTALLAKKASELAKKISKPSGDRIKITQAKQIKFPDGTMSAGPFEVVILDFVSANTYYQGAFNRDDVAPPDCFALGEEPSLLVASDSSPHKQSDTCSACPKNQFGSAMSGNGKACKNSRLLAVVPPDFGPDTPIWLLSVSPTAIRAFDAYVGSVASSFNAPPIRVITTIGFDPKSEFPTLRFGNPVPNERLAESVARMEEARTRLLTEPDYAARPQPSGVGSVPAPRGMGRSAARVVR